MATADEGGTAHVKLTAAGGLSFAGDLEITCTLRHEQLGQNEP
jgi:hypothetical protein